MERPTTISASASTLPADAGAVPGVSTAFVAERAVMATAYLALFGYSAWSSWAARRGSPCTLLYHASLLLGTIMKIVFFLLFAVASTGASVSIPQSVAYTFSTMPSLFFFTTFSALYFLWLDRHALNEQRTKKLAWTFFYMNATVYVVGIALFIADWASNKGTMDLLDSRSDVMLPERILGFIVALLYFPLGLGFLVVGQTAFTISKRFKDLLAVSSDYRPMKHSRLVETMPYIGCVAILCTLLMFIRGVILFVFQINDGPFLTWWCEAVYYLGLEALPIVLMNVVLIHKPSDQSAFSSHSSSVNEDHPLLFA